MPSLKIEITKRRDGAIVFRLTRPDGAATWSRYEGKTAGFFPLHDLQHYAVETVLGHRRGFYGLVAEGWDLGDFGAPWPRGPLPADMDPSELIVGMFDLERATGHLGTAEEYNEHLRIKLGSAGGYRWEPLTDAAVERIRTRTRELHGQWHELPPGETMTLAFDLPNTDSR